MNTPRAWGYFLPSKLNTAPLGIIQRQATRNAISILFGTIAGAVNTILILPAAFDGFEEGWGLLKVLTAYAMIFSQFIHGGIPNAIIRYFPKLNDDSRSIFLGRLFLIPLFGSLLFLLLIALTGSEGLRLVNPDDAEMLRNRLPELFVLTTVLTFFFALNGYVSAILKTTLFQFLNETFLKGWYLFVATLFLVDYISFDRLLLLYIAGYIIATLFLVAQALQNGFRIRLTGTPFPVPRREIVAYSIYSILDRGASIVVTNLDIIMIGILATLEDVAFYTLAFYIGSVTMMPQKSILTIANPVASAAVAANDNNALSEVYRKSSLMQVLLGGIIFAAIWASIDEIMFLLPDKFSGGKWVVFYIGLAKLVQMATGVSGGVLVYSKHFRLNFRLNIVLIALTILTNYYFMHPDHLNMGITGAALATFIAFAIHNVFKVVFIQRYFGMNPFNAKFGLVVLMVGLTAGGAYFWHPFAATPFVAVVVKGVLVSAVLVLLARALGVLPPFRQLLRL